MNLIEAYIYEVTKKLPKKMRADIALELRSTIEDMLPESYSEEEVKKVLSKLGNPAGLAASYRDTPQYLIGPQVYDAYIGTIKLIVPWAILITILVHIVESIMLFTGEEELLSAIIKAFAITIANIISVLLQVLFWITLTFVIIERTGGIKGNIPFLKNSDEWTPDDLKHTEIIPNDKNIPMSEIIFSLIGITILAIAYFNADRLVGIYTSDALNGLQFIMPFFNQDTLLSFAPIILICIVLSIGLSLYKWKVRKWTIQLASLYAPLQIISTIAFIMVVNHPKLINEATIPFMAELMQTTPTSVINNLDRILLASIVIAIVANVIDVFNGFRKAKI